MSKNVSNIISKKTILISTWTYPPQRNGVAHVAWQHAKGLVELGYDVTVVTSFDPCRKVENTKVKVVQFEIKGNYSPRTMLKPFKGDIKGYRQFIRNFRGDVILFHTCTVWNTATVLDILPKIKTKSILISHGVSFNTGSFLARLAWRPYVWRLNKTYNTFDQVVFLTKKSDKDRFLDKYLMDKKRFSRWSVIPNGSSFEKFQSVLPDFRNSSSIDKKQKLILCVSAFTQMKNQEMALNAFLNGGFKNATLVFIGEEMNEYARKLENKVRSLINSTGKVLLLTGLEREMIYAAYKAADIFLLPSRTEAQPLVLLDSMASGTPFISTNVGCVDELPGGVTVTNEQEMGKMINSFLANQEKLEILKKRGLNAIQNTYNWVKVVAQYDDLIEKIVY